MKKSMYRWFTVIMMAVLLIASIGCTQKQPEKKPDKPHKPAKTNGEKPGDKHPVDGPKVEVKEGEKIVVDKDGGFHLAEVKVIEGENVNVVITKDGSETSVPMSAIRKIVEKTWAKDEKVHAVKDGKFEPAVIEEVKEENKYLVKWDDGSTSEIVGAEIVDFIAPKGEEHHHEEPPKVDEGEKHDEEHKMDEGEKPEGDHPEKHSDEKHEVEPE